jgi:hypothetical protein
MKNIKNTEIKNSNESLTRKILLAGLGAFVKGQDVISRKYDRLMNDNCAILLFADTEELFS